MIGIDGSATPAETRDQVARIARRTAAAIGLDRDLREDEIVLDERYHAGTYGIPDASTLEAMRLAGRLEGMITDPVYEGKSMAGLIDLVTRGEIDRDSTVLYAHLGGQPALNAYALAVRLARPRLRPRRTPRRAPPARRAARPSTASRTRAGSGRAAARTSARVRRPCRGARTARRRSGRGRAPATLRPDAREAHDAAARRHPLEARVAGRATRRVIPNASRDAGADRRQPGRAAPERGERDRLVDERAADQDLLLGGEQLLAQRARRGVTSQPTRIPGRPYVFDRLVTLITAVGERRRDRQRLAERHLAVRLVDQQARRAVPLDAAR